MEKSSRRLVLHYNAACPKCVRKAQRTARLDWLGRVDLSTEESPAGPVPVGEIVVVDRQRGELLTGIYATRTICLHVPAFLPFGLLLNLPFMRRAISRRDTGCAGEACPLPERAMDTPAVHV